MKKSTLMLTIVTIILTLMLSLKFFFSSIILAKSRNFLVEYKLPSLAPMLEKVIPAVISVSVEGNIAAHATQSSYHSFRNNISLYNKDYIFKKMPLYDIFLQKINSKNETFSALGSGVIIDDTKGYAVTNNHVVSHADNIQVQLNDGRKYKAIVVGQDARSDIALIQLQGATKLTAIKIADSDKIKVGDYAVAIGNPYGLGETVTSGIISAIGRSGLNIEHYENFIQTDAAINKGNSGGALINLKGELIGINTAILAPEGGNIGIGFSIPSNMVKNLTRQIINFGKINRGELGIIGAELNSELVKAMKLNIQKGAFISRVYPNSSADQSGIKSGDIIVSLNNKPICSFASLRAEISSFPINTKIKLGILRKDHIENIIITLQKNLREVVNSSDVNVKIDGAKLSDYDFNKFRGVLINNVELNTAAFTLGLKKNDIILGVNRLSTTNIEDLRRVLNMKSSVLIFSVQRGNNMIYLLLQ